MITPDRASLAPTARQLEVLSHLRAYVDREGMPPTVRELADLIGVKSTNGVIDHLNALYRRGLVRKATGRARGWRPAL